LQNEFVNLSDITVRSSKGRGAIAPRHRPFHWDRGGQGDLSIVR